MPVGKATILRMLSDERRKASHIWIGVTAALLVLGVVGGGALFWHNRMVESQFEQKLAEAQRQAELRRQQADARLKDEMGITPAEIKRLGDATVYIEDKWAALRYRHAIAAVSENGQGRSEWLPGFVRLSDGTAVRWLTLEQNKDDVYPADRAINTRAAALSLTPTGHILTNKHMAAVMEDRARFPGLPRTRLDGRRDFQPRRQAEPPSRRCSTT